MELPCLALHHCDRSTTLFSVSEQKCITASDADEFLRNKSICPTARGLLLVRNPGSLVTFLWNPQDGDQVQLPPLEGVEDSVLMHSHCLLSDKPSSPGCVVLLVEGGDNTFIWYCHPGDDHWVKYDYDIGTQILPYPEGDEYEKITICPIAACRGKFYFNSTPTELGVLEFCPDPVFSSILIDDSNGGSYEPEDEEEGHQDDGSKDEVHHDDGSREEVDQDNDCSDCERYGDEEYEDEREPAASIYLVESGDELYRVTLLYVTPYDNEIDHGFVDKMDFSERQWRSVDDLGGRTFLLSLFHFGASCSIGKRGVLQDCIYVVYPRKREMQVFDVKEGTNELHKLDEALPADKAFWLLPANP